MAIKTDVNSLKFHSGRGNVSGELAKSSEEVLHEEAEKLEGLAEGVEGTTAGKKPVHITENGFHTGRGIGRGHGRS